MTAYILLRGKDFAIPDGLSTAIIGLFFGLVCGLFYYQRYHRSYYWVVSLTGGLMFTYISHILLSRNANADDTSSLELTLASFIIPFLLTLGLNHVMGMMKSHKRKRHAKQKTYSHFFDSVNAAKVLRADGKK